MKIIRLLAAGLVVGLGAVAAHALDATFNAAPPGTIAVGEITLGDRLAGKVDEYGEREVAQLVGILRSDLERELAGIGRLADRDQAEGVLDVVVEDARPNRPTPRQQTGVSQRLDPRRGYGPLDPRSVFKGGARVSAMLHSQGEQVASFDYEYETTPDIRAAEFATTWTDARRTFDRFASRMADAIEAESN